MLTVGHHAFGNCQNFHLAICVQAERQDIWDLEFVADVGSTIWSN
jgi:hypothetical protein